MADIVVDMLEQLPNNMQRRFKDMGDGTWAEVISAVSGAGTSSIGSTKDNGPAQTLTRSYVTSADATGVIDLTAAPTSGQKIVIMDLVISTDTAMNVTVQMETSANVLAKYYMPANSTVQISPRGFFKGDAADKKIQLDASVAGNLAISINYFSEA